MKEYLEEHIAEFLEKLLKVFLEPCRNRFKSLVAIKSSSWVNLWRNRLERKRLSWRSFRILQEISEKNLENSPWRTFRKNLLDLIIFPYRIKPASQLYFFYHATVSVMPQKIKGKLAGKTFFHNEFYVLLAIFYMKACGNMCAPRVTNAPTQSST